MIAFKPMNQEEFKQYLSFAIEDFAKDKVTSGNWSEDEAIDLSKKEFSRLLPKDEKSDHNHLFSIFNNQQLVGMIWIAQTSTTTTNPNEGFIYDFIIFESHQGQGYGKQAMKEAEIIAKKLGINKIGLHVFDHNKIARGLYEKLDYEITNITMSKSI
ncbi:GNAT family N-acetyltransferase [Viridibacillus arvi]|uniref:GNAT family N-acetyltransferase n=1 Tax=Viridibacillus arvi TaxID=263475 RepID=UPI003CFCDFED